MQEELERLRQVIKPELEGVFGAVMADLILNRAGMKLAAESASASEPHLQYKAFLDCLANDDMIVGMWGTLQTKEKISEWKALPLVNAQGGNA